MGDNIILKYRREFDCWLCDECGIENPNTQNSCTVCNAPRPVNPTILKAWSPEDEANIPAKFKAEAKVKKPIPVKEEPRKISGPIFHDKPRDEYVKDDHYEPPSSSGNMSRVIAWLIIFIIIFGVLTLYGLNNY
ncbi:MAG: hypothetical protein IKJ68_07460 [Clostridia bacterium]|nr:hypothetical protein [Clostridia bacterium]